MKEVELNVILDLIYKVQMEFSNELDYDYESNSFVRKDKKIMKLEKK